LRGRGFFRGDCGHVSKKPEEDETGHRVIAACALENVRAVLIMIPPALRNCPKPRASQVQAEPA
jgi:hypothetical protein